MATKTTLKNKGFKSLDAGKMKVTPGPSGKMQTFKPVGTQKPGVSSREAAGGGKSNTGVPAGPSGKMHTFDGVRKQKSGITSVK